MSRKPRLLHPRLAAIVAGLRHGEMLFLGDAGSGIHPASLVPLDPRVEVLELGIVPGCPSLADLLPVLWEVGDFESAVVTREMRAANPEGRELVERVAGADHVYELRYLPDFYDLRDRAKAFVATGDYAVHANVALVAGYPSPPIPLDWLTSSDWFTELRADPGRGDPREG